MATVIEETLRIKKYLKKLTIIGELDNIKSASDVSMLGIVSGKLSTLRVVSQWVLPLFTRKSDSKIYQKLLKKKSPRKKD